MGFESARDQAIDEINADGPVIFIEKLGVDALTDLLLNGLSVHEYEPIRLEMIDQLSKKYERY